MIQDLYKLLIAALRAFCLSCRRITLVFIFYQLAKETRSMSFIEVYCFVTSTVG